MRVGGSPKTAAHLAPCTPCQILSLLIGCSTSLHMLYMDPAPNLGSEPPICELPLLIAAFHTFPEPGPSLSNMNI